MNLDPDVRGSNAGRVLTRDLLAYVVRLRPLFVALTESVGPSRFSVARTVQPSAAFADTVMPRIIAELRP